MAKTQTQSGTQRAGEGAMKTLIIRACMSFILLIASFIYMGCGMLEKDQPAAHFDPFYDDPYYYKPGDSIRGGDFSFLDANIYGYIWDQEKQQFVEIVDGSYVRPGVHRIGIKATPRREPNIIDADFEDINDLVQGVPMDQRVYASDGGNTYLVEAEYNEMTGLYVCDFKVDGRYLTTTILIEVLYPDGMANKEKIVLATRKNIIAPLNKVVKEGVGITVNTDFVKEMIAMVMEDEAVMQSFMGMLGSFLCDMDTSAIEKLLPLGAVMLPYMAVTPGEDTFMDINVTGPRGRSLASVGINIEDSYEDGDKIKGGMALSMPMSVGTGEFLSFQPDRLVDSVLDLFMPAMTEPISLNFDAIVQPIMVDVLDTVLAGMNMNESMELMMADMVNKIFPLNLSVYANIFARPEENTDSLGVIYAGAFLADTRKLPSPDDLVITGRCFPEWPVGTTVDDSVSLDVTPIKKEGVDMGIALSRYQINSIFSQMMRIWAMKMPNSFMNLLTTLIKIDNASSEIESTMYFNPQGTTIDFYDSRGEISGILLANDVKVEILDNDAPLNEMSIDAAFRVRAKFRFEEENLYVDLGLTVIPELTKVHVYEDLIGLTPFDHSTFGKTLLEIMMFQELLMGDEVREFVLSINMTDMIGIIAKEEGTNLTAKDGNCYMSMALDDETPIDFSKIEAFAGACFISRVNI